MKILKLQVALSEFLLNKNYLEFERFNILQCGRDSGFFYCIPIKNKTLICHLMHSVSCSQTHKAGGHQMQHTSRKQNQCLANLFGKVVYRGRKTQRKYSVYLYCRGVKQDLLTKNKVHHVAESCGRLNGTGMWSLECGSWLQNPSLVTNSASMVLCLIREGKRIPTVNSVQNSHFQDAETESQRE